MSDPTGRPLVGRIITEVDEAMPPELTPARIALTPGVRRPLGQLPAVSINPLTPRVGLNHRVKSTLELEHEALVRDWSAELDSLFTGIDVMLRRASGAIATATNDHHIAITNQLRISRSRDLGAHMAQLAIGAETGEHTLPTVAHDIVTLALMGGAR